MENGFGQRKRHSVYDAVDNRVERGPFVGRVARGVRNRVAEILEPLPGRFSVGMCGVPHLGFASPTNVGSCLKGTQQGRRHQLVVGRSLSLFEGAHPAVRDHSPRRRLHASHLQIVSSMPIALRWAGTIVQFFVGGTVCARLQVSGPIPNFNGDRDNLGSTPQLKTRPFQ